MRNSTRTMLLAICVAGTAASAQAIDTTRASATDAGAIVETRAQTAAHAGPRIDATALAMRNTVFATEAVPLAPASGAGMGKPAALILVGLAAIVIGDVMDDRDLATLFTVGGAVTALIGFYQLLK
jgi:hypothetical protein